MLQQSNISVQFGKPKVNIIADILITDLQQLKILIFKQSSEIQARFLSIYQEIFFVIFFFTGQIILEVLLKRSIGTYFPNIQIVYFIYGHTLFYVLPLNAKINKAYRNTDSVQYYSNRYQLSNLQWEFISILFFGLVQGIYCNLGQYYLTS